jgi:hypothetical protein
VMLPKAVGVEGIKPCGVRLPKAVGVEGIIHATGELANATLGGVRAEASQCVGVLTAFGLVPVSIPIAPLQAFEGEEIGRHSTGSVLRGHTLSASTG